MLNPELTLIGINVLLIAIAYFIVYPFVKKHYNQPIKLVWFDLIISIIAISIAAVLYYNTQQEFLFFGFSLNWFWFSILSYSILEVPILLKLYQH